MKVKEEYGGCVYIMDYGDRVKIGSSRNPNKRMKDISSHLYRYAGMVCNGNYITDYHVNYCENEKKLHAIFQKERFNNSEVFLLPFDTAVNEAKKLTYDYDFKKEELRVKKNSENFCENIKKMMTDARVIELANKLIDVEEYIKESNFRLREYTAFYNAGLTLHGYFEKDYYVQRMKWDGWKLKLEEILLFIIQSFAKEEDVLIRIEWKNPENAKDKFIQEICVIYGFEELEYFLEFQTDDISSIYQKIIEHSKEAYQVIKSIKQGSDPFCK